jgi:hypothetical protein
MMATGVDFRSDHLERDQQGLHRIATGAPSFGRPFGHPISKPTYPINLRPFGRMNLNRYFRGAQLFPQDQRSFGDDHNLTSEWQGRYRLASKAGRETFIGLCTACSTSPSR